VPEERRRADQAKARGAGAVLAARLAGRGARALTSRRNGFNAEAAERTGRTPRTRPTCGETTGPRRGPAPKGPAIVAAGGAMPAAWRAARNPWTRAHALSASAPRGAGESPLAQGMAAPQHRPATASKTDRRGGGRRHSRTCGPALRPLRAAAARPTFDNRPHGRMAPARPDPAIRRQGAWLGCFFACLFRSVVV